MGIWTSPSINNINGWEFNLSNQTMQRIGSDESISLFWNKSNNIDDLFRFSNSKNYLVRTKIKNLNTLSDQELTIRTVWNISFQNPPITSFTETDGYLNFYSNPNAFIENRISHFYNAKDTFTNTKGILNVSVSEIDWDIIGFSWIDNGDPNYSTSTHGLGWNFINNTFGWLYQQNGGFNPATYVNNSLRIDPSYKKINCLYSYVPAQLFNIQFDYSSLNGNIDIYLSERPPYNGTDLSLFNSFLESANKILSLEETIENGVLSIPNLLLSLIGGQYIIIVSSPIDEAQIANIKLSNLKLSSSYHPQNNILHPANTNTYEVDIEGASYTAIVGDNEGGEYKLGDEIPVIKSKIGNGYFDLGIWENGVWNSGWRKDENVVELFDIDYNIKVFSDFKWHVIISGLKENIEKRFKVGDLVSLGNIVAIDINEERKQLIDPYKIVNIEFLDTEDNFQISYNLASITIEIETTFPIRRIQKDSENHRIKITKNIWLSGAFFNGYFTGVWNYGLFKGYPLITEMFNTHWKDGFYEGGHFNSKYIRKENIFTSTFFDDTKLGLVTVNPHKLKVGDIIKIDKTDKTLNSVYDTTTKVIKIISKNIIVTDIDFNVKTEGESGVFINLIADSVIQNMNFKSENVSKITSNTSLSSTSVFNYNSWVDVNYLEDVAINIGKNQNLLDTISKRSYSENNLYGYKTLDVLSSVSEFRNSYSLEKKKYNLGIKYKVFKNYIGDAGLFNEFFDTDNEIENFLLQGWTFSVADNSSISYKRTLDEGDFNIIGQELMITAENGGGVLDINNNIDNIIENRQNTDIEKNRYTKIEFDLVNNSSDSNTYISSNGIEEPILHFNNINKIQRKIDDNTLETLINTSLPISKNVNLLNIDNNKKVEYFYNKKHLSMYLKGSGQNGIDESSVVIKNFKFLEIDMIPFFKYFNQDTINKSIQIPFQGIAPFIDYDNINFVFLDNIKVGLDSISTINTFDVFTGVGESAGVISPIIPPIVTLRPILPTRPSEPTPTIPIVTIEYLLIPNSIQVSVYLDNPISQSITFNIRIRYNLQQSTNIFQRQISINIQSGSPSSQNSILVESEPQNIEICIISISNPDLVNVSENLLCDII
jgi:hypothetical protein